MIAVLERLTRHQANLLTRQGRAVHVPNRDRPGNRRTPVREHRTALPGDLDPRGGRNGDQPERRFGGTARHSRPDPHLPWGQAGGVAHARRPVLVRAGERVDRPPDIPPAVAVPVVVGIAPGGELSVSVEIIERLTRREPDDHAGNRVADVVGDAGNDLCRADAVGEQLPGCGLLHDDHERRRMELDRHLRAPPHRRCPDPGISNRQRTMKAEVGDSGGVRHDGRWNAAQRVPDPVAVRVAGSDQGVPASVDPIAVAIVESVTDREPDRESRHGGAFASPGRRHAERQAAGPVGDQGRRAPRRGNGQQESIVVVADQVDRRVCDRRPGGRLQRCHPVGADIRDEDRPSPTGGVRRHGIGQVGSRAFARRLGEANLLPLDGRHPVRPDDASAHDGRIPGRERGLAHLHRANRVGGVACDRWIARMIPFTTCEDDEKQRAGDRNRR